VRLVCDPLVSEVDLIASADELSRLARVVADGEGLLSSTVSPGSSDLAGVEVGKTSGPGVLIHHDPERRILVISGDSAGRAVLADNLLSMAPPRTADTSMSTTSPGTSILLKDPCRWWSTARTEACPPVEQAAGRGDQ
jgi:hypothetical protein